MSTKRIDEYQVSPDSKVGAAVRQTAIQQYGYINGEYDEIPAFQREYHGPVCEVCCRRCTNQTACIERLIEWFELWPMCCTSPATCSHETYRIAG